MKDDEIRKELCKMIAGLGMGLELKPKGDEDDNDDDFIMCREYAIPECVGCMVKVEYFVGTFVNFENAHISFQATIYRRTSNDESTSLLACEDEIIGLYGDYHYDAKRGKSAYEVKSKVLKKKLDNVIKVTETKLKNIFGMVRLD